MQLLRRMGCSVYVLGGHRRRGDYQGTMQTPGLPDVLAFLPLVGGRGRRLLVIECKAAGGRLRPEQVAFQGACIDSGVAHVVGGLNDVILFLRRGGWLKPEQVPHYRQPRQEATCRP